MYNRIKELKMKKTINLITFLAITLFTISPVISQVTYDYDKTVDFSKYKTVRFGGWEKGSDKLLNELDKDRAVASFKAEFEKRGIQIVDTDASMVVTLYLVIDNKTSTTAYTNFNGGMGYGMGYGGYGMRGFGPGWGWGMGSATTTYSEQDYQVGTLVVDCYDGETKKLLWQGVSRKTINKNQSKHVKTIPKNVAKLMKKYPVSIPK